MKEYFKINNVDVGFADHSTKNTFYTKGSLDTKVLIRKGKLNINLLTPSLNLTKALHNGMLDAEYYENQCQVDWIRITTYSDLTIPNGKYDTKINCPYTKGVSGFEVYGFPMNVKFHGIIDIQEGHLHISGEFRSAYDENSATIPIEIFKVFEPKKLIPKRIEHTLETALKTEPTEVYELRINKSNIDGFPKEILEFKNLESLWIGGQGNATFSAFPDSFFELRRLNNLRIYGSDIKYLSDKISNLKQLEELLIESSQLTQLPETITELPNLVEMSFKYNQLLNLPEGICNMPSLKHLEITGNEFNILPECLKNIFDVKVDRKYQKFYKDLSYKSKNANSIDISLFDLTNYPNEKAFLEEQINNFEGLKPFKDFILDCTTIGTFLIYKNEKNEIPLGTSKVGGSPDLPSNILHPSNKHGEYYLFHAQINCEEIAPYQYYLPRKGILYFFVNDEEYAQKPIVIYTENTDQLIRTPYNTETEFSDADFNGEFRESVAVEFLNSISLPCLYNAHNHGIERFPKYAELWEKLKTDSNLEKQFDRLEEEIFELEDKLQAIAQEQTSSKYRTHGLNCSVFTQHESPQEQAAIKYGGEPSEWCVLLNMESTGEFNFWDAGTLSYCIHKKDLAIHDFSKISSSIESS